MKVRRKDNMLLEIMKGHQKYVDWWLPIDVASGSSLAPMCCYGFCEYLLIFNDEDWWYRWMDSDFLTEESKSYDKRTVLGLLRQHTLNWIDLNNMSCDLEEHKQFMKNRIELR